MKHRQGFVSNSSSSSFIIGVALVPSDKVEEAKKFDGYGIRLMDVHDAIESGTNRWDGDGLDVEKGVYTVSSFNYTDVSAYGIMDAYEADQGVRIMVMEGSGDEPTLDEDAWEYNYDDVDMDWFSKDQQGAAEFIKSIGGEVQIGAGRNG